MIKRYNKFDYNTNANLNYTKAVRKIKKSLGENKIRVVCDRKAFDGNNKKVYRSPSKNNPSMPDRYYISPGSLTNNAVSVIDRKIDIRNLRRNTNVIADFQDHELTTLDRSTVMPLYPTSRVSIIRKDSSNDGVNTTVTRGKNIVASSLVPEVATYQSTKQDVAAVSKISCNSDTQDRITLSSIKKRMFAGDRNDGQYYVLSTNDLNQKSNLTMYVDTANVDLDNEYVLKESVVQNSLTHHKLKRHKVDHTVNLLKQSSNNNFDREKLSKESDVKMLELWKGKKNLEREEIAKDVLIGLKDMNDSIPVHNIMKNAAKSLLSDIKYKMITLNNTDIPKDRRQKIIEETKTLLNKRKEMVEGHMDTYHFDDNIWHDIDINARFSEIENIFEQKVLDTDKLDKELAIASDIMDSLPYTGIIV